MSVNIELQDGNGYTLARGYDTNAEPTHLLAVCMDEANVVGPESLIAGLAGTLVTQEGGGNQNLFPDALRQTIAEVAPLYLQATEKVADTLGLNFVGTDHPGCGWDKAQAISPEDQPAMTRQLLNGVGIPYAGQLPVHSEPLPLDMQSVTAAITRPVEDHVHPADGTILTVGGFMSQAEKTAIMERAGITQGAFHISFDAFHQAVQDGVKPESLLATLTHEVGLTVKLSPAAHDVIVAFDAQQLGVVETQENLQAVQTVLALLGLAQQ